DFRRAILRCQDHPVFAGQLCADLLSADKSRTRTMAPTTSCFRERRPIVAHRGLGNRLQKTRRSDNLRPIVPRGRPDRTVLLGCEEPTRPIGNTTPKLLVL